MDIYIYAAAFILAVIDSILFYALLKAFERIANLERNLTGWLLKKQDYRANPFNSVMLSRRIDKLERERGKQHGRKH
jgi:hypothetical protein